ncbi:hypothetical protein DFP83_1252 [Idiomarina fontislapidosi]|nr:hypothetical protein DFP83_1252 [Idiomarina fontislapidosi]
MVQIIAMAYQWQLLEQSHEVIHRHEAVGFGGFDHAIEYGAGLRTAA